MNRKEQRQAMNSIWHCTQKGQQNPEKALLLLERLLQEEQGTDCEVLKQGVVWNVLRSCRQPLDNSSLGLLETSLALLEENPRLYHVNMTEFVMTTLVKSDSPERAQVLLNRHTDTLLETSDWDQPFLATAKNAIWFHMNKNVNRQEGAEKALLLLERLLQQDKNLYVCSKGMVFNVLRACQQDPVASVDILERVLSLVEWRNLVDAKILTQVLVAMARCRADDAMSRAEFILKNSSLTVTPNPYHYCAILDGYAKRGDAKKAEQLFQSMADRNVPPNTVACNCVLDALLKSSENKVVERSEQLLKRMNQDRRMKPDVVTFTNLLNIYSKHAMGEQAERLLERMLALKDEDKLMKGPSELNYRCVIDALAKSGQAEEAERLLGRMRGRNVVPNKFHYCGVLNAFAREGKPLEAERLLSEIQETGNLNLNVVAYNCVMYAWAKSCEVDSPFRAKALLDRMLEMGVAPNLITYNCLLGACANRSMAKESEGILKQMHKLHEAGELDAAPNTISYNYVLGE